MIPINIDFEDGLVNGVIKRLRHIEVNSAGEMVIMWLEFQSSSVGKKKRKIDRKINLKRYFWKLDSNHKRNLGPTKAISFWFDTKKNHS